MSSIVDIYQRNFEAVAADKDLSIATPFTAMFLNQTPQIDFGSDQVTIEMYKGNRKVAPLVARRISGSSVDNPSITPGSAGANDYLYALASQDFDIPASILNKRAPGEPPYAGPVGDDSVKLYRRAFWMNQLSKDAVRRIIMRDELLAIQSFFDAEMDIGDTYQSNTYLSFPRNSNLKGRTVTTSWGTAASATPWTDYGDAQKAIKTYSQVDGANMWLSMLPSDAMENLKAIYRSQRSLESGPNLQFNDYSFNPELGVPPEFAFLIQNGCEYQGWIRSDYSQSKIYLFTIPEGYDASLADGTETYTDFISGDTVALCLYNPSYFKAYFGPGKKDPPSVNLYRSVFPQVSMVQTPQGLTIGQSRIPANTLLLNVYELGRNEGIGGTVEHAPIFANVRPDVVATIATTTTA